MAKVLLSVPRKKVGRFCSWVAGMLTAKGITQKELADYLGITQVALNYKIHGKTEWRLVEFYLVQEYFGEEF